MIILQKSHLRQIFFKHILNRKYLIKITITTIVWKSSTSSTLMTRSFSSKWYFFSLFETNLEIFFSKISWLLHWERRNLVVIIRWLPRSKHVNIVNFCFGIIYPRKNYHRAQLWYRIVSCSVTEIYKIFQQLDGDYFYIHSILDTLFYIYNYC